MVLLLVVLFIMVAIFVTMMSASFMYMKHDQEERWYDWIRHNDVNFKTKDKK